MYFHEPACTIHWNVLLSGAEGLAAKTQRLFYLFSTSLHLHIFYIYGNGFSAGRRTSSICGKQISPFFKKIIIKEKNKDLDDFAFAYGEKSWPSHKDSAFRTTCSLWFSTISTIRLWSHCRRGDGMNGRTGHKCDNRGLFSELAGWLFLGWEEISRTLLFACVEGKGDF